MNLLFPSLAIFGGVVAASSLVIARRPDSKKAFDRIAPYQGIVGVAMLVAGGLWLARILPHLGGLLKAAPMSGSITIAAVAGTIAIGFLLGYALVDRFVLSKNPAAAAKGAQTVRRLAAIQTPLGLATAALGVAAIVL
ncbi:MAG: hypothetical protein AAGI22_00630 [Planctomycetota bacterium]